MPSIADRLRTKLESIETKLASKTAKFQTKVRVQRVEVIDPQNELVRMKSSWIRNFTYDNHSHTLYMTVHTGKTYSWDNVDPQVAWNCIRGNATCTTNDRLKRWWVGKNPSLGAVYWKYLRNLTPHVTSTAPHMPGMNPYFDILNEEYTPQYNVDISRKGKKGRPTKEEDRSRKFGWAGRYKGVRA